MGTRHCQTIIDKDGNVKLREYGQYDGYPSGQGVDILTFLNNADLSKYQENLSKLKKTTQSSLDELYSDYNWEENRPWLSAACGSKIHQMIEEGRVDYVVFISEDEAKKLCEGFYCINFKENKFISDFYNLHTEYSLDNLPTESEYINAMDEYNVIYPDTDLEILIED